MPRLGNQEANEMAKPAQKILFFYCYQCRDYELKTSPHFRNQKRRFARRKKARKAENGKVETT